MQHLVKGFCYIQARVKVGVGPRHYTTVGPSVLSLSQFSEYCTENKYVKRVTFCVCLNQVKYSLVLKMHRSD